MSILAPFERDISWLKTEYAQINARQSILLEEKSRVVGDMLAAEEYLEDKAETLHVLQAIQEEWEYEEKREVEDLLSQLVRDILPHRADCKVVLQRGTYRDHTTLDVCIDNEGHPENVWEQRGGSINSILSLGLQFITLVKSGNRPFVLFDEADKAIKEELIPAFAKVVAELSRTLGVQVLYVSHLDAGIFEGLADIISFDEVDNKVVARHLKRHSVEKDEWISSGVSSIRYKNMRRLQDVTLELGPFMTVLTGTNDVGKSSALKAFRALARNGGTMGLISHGADSMRVEATIDDGSVLAYEYFRGKNKAKVKATYTMTDASGTDIEEPHNGKESLPPWMDDYLAMPLVAGVDINFCSQNHPAQMLDNKCCSPTQRAKLLSIGSEAAKVVDMIGQHRANVTAHTKAQNETKRSLSRVKNELNIVRPVCDLDPAEFDPVLKKLEQDYDFVTQLNAVGSEMVKLQEMITLLETLPEDSIELQKVDVANISSISALNDLADEMGQTTGMLQIYSQVECEDPLSLTKPRDNAEFVSIGRQMVSSLSLIQALESLPEGRVELREVVHSEGVDALAKSLSEATKAIRGTSGRLAAMEQQQSQIKVNIASLLEEVGDVCPFCKGSMNGEKHAH
ncbi:hypothetical protein [Neptuniibacter sp. QD37_11]|uniref:hypothetical protein n=1 Tax=Neptuniibacter sp. QD37_11 TaxID=3398209 RepID=UPI0039F59F50